MCACDFTACCDVSQPNRVPSPRKASCARPAGSDSERRGTWIWYRLRPEAVARFSELAGGFSPGPGACASPARNAGSASSSHRRDDGPARSVLLRPVKHVVMHGNPGVPRVIRCIRHRLTAREILVDLSSAAFDLMDQVFAEGRPLATWLPGQDDDWRLTVAPRIDPENGETYAVTFHLRARSDVPILA